MKVISDNHNIDREPSITEIIEMLQEKHGEVYWEHIYGQIYIYKPLGRKDHRELCMNEELSNEEKEDEVCRACILYPQIDYDNIPAGIIQKVFSIIMKNSFLDSEESRVGILNYYRNEMFDFQNQIPCMINEAFPNLDIDEIENWGVEKTAKYLAKAEFKLANFRGLQVNTELMESTQRVDENKEEIKEESTPVKKEEKPKGKNKKEGLTPERLRELQMQFPDIDWTADTIMNEGIEGMRESVDTLSPALRAPL